MTEENKPQTMEPSTEKQSGPEEEYYDLLPIEKKLIGYSLGLGIGLLVVFIFIFGVFKIH